IRSSARTRRIINHAFQHLPSEGIDADDLRHFRYGRAEITIPVSEGRNGLKLIVDVLGFTELLEIDEEERLVAPDRTTDGESVIISAGTGPRVGFAGFERIPGIEYLVYEIVVDRSMKLIGSRLHRYVEDAATNLAVFCRKVAGLNGHF